MRLQKKEHSCYEKKYARIKQMPERYFMDICRTMRCRFRDETFRVLRSGNSNGYWRDNTSNDTTRTFHLSFADLYLNNWCVGVSIGQKINKYGLII